MRCLCSALRLPVGALLQVEHLVARMVAVLLFRVGVFACPRLTAQALAVGTLHIQLGDGHAVAVLLRVEALYGEVAALGRLAKLYGLPAVASLEAASGDGRCTVQVGLVAYVVVLVALLQLQLVQLRLSLSPDHSLLRTNHIEHDNLVLALLQPAARDV